MKRGMEVFILDRVQDLTSSYHPEGGLVVIAPGLDEAKQLVAETPDPETWRDGPKLQQPTDEEWAAAKRLPLSGKQEPAVHVHPDSGCC